MSNRSAIDGKWNERSTEVTATAPLQNDSTFRLMFERSADAISLLDAHAGVFIDSNPAAVEMLRAPSKEALLQATPADLSPERQPDGRLSQEKTGEMIADALARGSVRFEWMARRFDGSELLLEVALTCIQPGERPLMLTVSREITERKKAEARIQQLNQDLELRVRERTVELVQANEQLKAEVRERRRREKVQRALYQISEAIHTTEDLNSLYLQVHSTIQGLMDARNFYLALLDSGAGFVHFPYWVDEVDPCPKPFKLDTGLTSYVLRTGKALLVNSETPIRKPQSGVAILQDSAGEYVYAEAGTPSAVWLGAPMSARGKTFGVMAVQNYSNASAYGEEEKQILTFVAEQTALAIERKQAEQNLRESEEKHRALFEATSQGVMLHDEHQFLEVNSAALRILGLQDASEVVGKHPVDFAAPAQLNGEPSDVAARRFINECMERGTARFDWLCQTPEGEVFPIETILTRVQWGGRQIIQAVVNDIRARKQAEAELLKALEKERELSQLKSNFVSMVSHEFRTPLGIILSSAEILDHYFERLKPDDRRQHLQSIQKNTRRMAELMEEVLLLGRLEAGKADFNPVGLDLEAFCRRVLDDLVSSTGGRCPIILETDGPLATAHADERLLEHILCNLLSNAVKYSPAGAEVRFIVQRSGVDAQFTIADQGIGIPEQDQPWLFKAFHRGRNASHLPGTGLGLMIVKRCVELHRGAIRIESAPGVGTSVLVRLPLFSESANKISWIDSAL